MPKDYGQLLKKLEERRGPGTLDPEHMKMFGISEDAILELLYVDTVPFFVEGLSDVIEEAYRSGTGVRAIIDQDAQKGTDEFLRHIMKFVRAIAPQASSESLKAELAQKSLQIAREVQGRVQGAVRPVVAPESPIGPTEAVKKGEMLTEEEAQKYFGVSLGSLGVNIKDIGSDIGDENDISNLVIRIMKSRKKVILSLSRDERRDLLLKLFRTIKDKKATTPRQVPGAGGVSTVTGLTRYDQQWLGDVGDDRMIERRVDHILDPRTLPELLEDGEKMTPEQRKEYKDKFEVSSRIKSGDPGRVRVFVDDFMGRVRDFLKILKDSDLSLDRTYKIRVALEETLPTNEKIDEVQAPLKAAVKLSGLKKSDLAIVLRQNPESMAIDPGYTKDEITKASKTLNELDKSYKNEIDPKKKEEIKKEYNESLNDAKRKADLYDRSAALQPVIDAAGNYLQAITDMSDRFVKRWVIAEAFQGDLDRVIEGLSRVTLSFKNLMLQRDFRNRWNISGYMKKEDLEQKVKETEKTAADSEKAITSIVAKLSKLLEDMATIRGSLGVTLSTTVAKVLKDVLERDPSHLTTVKNEAGKSVDLPYSEIYDLDVVKPEDLAKINMEAVNEELGDSLAKLRAVKLEKYYTQINDKFQDLKKLSTVIAEEKPKEKAKEKTAGYYDIVSNKLHCLMNKIAAAEGTISDSRSKSPTSSGMMYDNFFYRKTQTKAGQKSLPDFFLQDSTHLVEKFVELLEKNGLPPIETWAPDAPKEKEPTQAEIAERQKKLEKMVDDSIEQLLKVPGGFDSWLKNRPQEAMKTDRELQRLAKSKEERAAVLRKGFEPVKKLQDKYVTQMEGLIQYITDPLEKLETEVKAEFSEATKKVGPRKEYLRKQMQGVKELVNESKGIRDARGETLFEKMKNKAGDARAKLEAFEKKYGVRENQGVKDAPHQRVLDTVLQNSGKAPVSAIEKEFVADFNAIMGRTSPTIPNDSEIAAVKKEVTTKKQTPNEALTSLVKKYSDRGPSFLSILKKKAGQPPSTEEERVFLEDLNSFFIAYPAEARDARIPLRDVERLEQLKKENPELFKEEPRSENFPVVLKAPYEVIPGMNDIDSAIKDLSLSYITKDVKDFLARADSKYATSILESMLRRGGAAPKTDEEKTFVGLLNKATGRTSTELPTKKEFYSLKNSIPKDSENLSDSEKELISKYVDAPVTYTVDVDPPIDLFNRKNVAPGTESGKKEDKTVPETEEEKKFVEELNKITGRTSPELPTKKEFYTLNNSILRNSKNLSAPEKKFISKFNETTGLYFTDLPSMKDVVQIHGGMATQYLEDTTAAEEKYDAIETAVGILKRMPDDIKKKIESMPGDSRKKYEVIINKMNEKRRERIDNTKEYFKEIAEARTLVDFGNDLPELATPEPTKRITNGILTLLARFEAQAAEYTGDRKPAPQSEGVKGRTPDLKVVFRNAVVTPIEAFDDLQKRLEVDDFLYSNLRQYCLNLEASYNAMTDPDKEGVSAEVKADMKKQLDDVKEIVDSFSTKIQRLNGEVAQLTAKIAPSMDLYMRATREALTNLSIAKTDLYTKKGTDIDTAKFIDKYKLYFEMSLKKEIMKAEDVAAEIDKKIVYFTDQMKVLGDLRKRITQMKEGHKSYLDKQIKQLTKTAVVNKDPEPGFNPGEQAIEDTSSRDLNIKFRKPEFLRVLEKTVRYFETKKKAIKDWKSLKNEVLLQPKKKTVENWIDPKDVEKVKGDEYRPDEHEEEYYNHFFGDLSMYEILSEITKVLIPGLKMLLKQKALPESSKYLLTVEEAVDKIEELLNKYADERTQVVNRHKEEFRKYVDESVRAEMLETYMERDPKDPNKVTMKQLSDKEAQMLKRMFLQQVYRYMDHLWSQKSGQNVGVWGQKDQNYYGTIWEAFRGVGGQKSNKVIMGILNALKADVRADESALTGVRFKSQQLEEELKKFESGLREQGKDPSKNAYIQELIKIISGLKVKEKAIKAIFDRMMRVKEAQYISDIREGLRIKLEGISGESETGVPVPLAELEKKAPKAKKEKSDSKVKEHSVALDKTKAAIMKDLEEEAEKIVEIKNDVEVFEKKKEAIRFRLLKIVGGDITAVPKPLDTDKEVPSTVKSAYTKDHRDFNLRILYGSEMQKVMAKMLAKSLK